MKCEHDTIVRSKAWILVPYPPNMKIIGNKWIFQVKEFVDGALDKLKVRVVAKGYL